jgi:hypothetical protein
VAGERPDFFQCLTCETLVVRDWIRESSYVVKGGEMLLYAIPKNPSAFNTRGIITGAEYVSSACPAVAVAHDHYETMTMKRKQGQSANCSLLDAQHYMPDVRTRAFRERLTSLVSNVEKDMVFDEVTWAQMWLETMPTWEYAEFMAKDPATWGKVYQSTHPRCPDWVATQW